MWKRGTGRDWVRWASVAALLSSGLPLGCSAKAPATGETQPTGDEHSGGADSGGADSGDADNGDAPSGDEAEDASTAMPEHEDSGVGPASSNTEDESVPQFTPPTASQSPATSDEGLPVTAAGDATKLDLLLVVDNSANMPEKAAVLAESVEYLLEQLAEPPCVDANGKLTPSSGQPCPAGTTQVHAPVADMHVGVITTSLGAYGSKDTCVVDASRPETAQNDDGAHLVGSLPRGADLPGGDFLTRGPDSEQSFSEFLGDITAHITAAGEHGCGYEAQLEAWTHFLVDPAPYTRIVRRGCNADDVAESCNGPELDANGQALVDTTLLAQRAAFLRPDSLVGIVVLTDENDCSMRSAGQAWIVTEQQDTSGTFRGSAACEADPNDPCCQSCGSPRVPAGCPTDTDGKAVGCAEPTYPLWSSTEPTEDSPNLRCFQQKRRFGADFLFPTERYVTALTQSRICPSDTNLGVAGANFCNSGELTSNPLWVNGNVQRPPGRVFFATIAGVPWQDLAVDPDAEVVTYRDASPDADPVVDWDLLLGVTFPDGTRLQYPGADGVMDQLLIESVEPRPGTNPPTDVALAAPDAPYLANPINGHEWNIADRTALQYSCLMPMKVPEVCLSEAEQIALSEDGSPVHSCHCSSYGNEEFRSPTCQAPDDSYGLTKYFSPAFPPTRLHQVQAQLAKDDIVTPVVGSVCAKSHDATLNDSGFRPTMDLLLDGFRRQLQ